MESAIQGSTRRSMLKRGLVVLGAALGIEAAARAGTAQAVRPGPTVLGLYGRGFHLHAADRKAGEVPSKGDRMTTYGELLDRTGGTKIGDFTSAFFALGSPFAVGALTPGSLELHSFNLKHGTILGMGSTVAAGESVYAIVGGTGSYAGAQGTYVARQQPRELGGNGTAEFKLTITLAA